MADGLSREGHRLPLVAGYGKCNVAKLKVGRKRFPVPQFVAPLGERMTAPIDREGDPEAAGAMTDVIRGVCDSPGDDRKGHRRRAVTSPA